MSGSSTCRSRRGLAALLLLAAIAGGAPAAAVDPDRNVSQYLREAWSSDRGYAGGPVHGITQTPDGYLWIAAERGLVRFDGVAFKLFEYRPTASTAGPTMLGLTALADGTVWARVRGPALVRYQAGRLENVLPRLSLPETVITSMFQRRDGTLVLATLGQGMMAHRDNALAVLVRQEQLPTSFVLALAEASDGTMWIGTRDAGLYRFRHGQVTAVEGLPDRKVNCLMADSDGMMWIGTDNGVVRWDGRALVTSGVPPELRSVRALTMFKDRDRNIWIGASNGLIRVNDRGAATMRAPDGRAYDTVEAVFEDRDGNLWIGSTRGLERIRDGVFTTYTATEGLPAATQGPVYTDDDDRSWVAPSTGGLFWFRRGQVERVTAGGVATDVVYSIAGRTNEVWIGRQRGGLTRLRATGSSAIAADTFTQADGLAQNSVYAVAGAPDGSVWAGTLSGGVSHLVDGRFTTYTVTDGLASNTVSTILVGRNGTIWFGTPNGVSALSAGRWRSFTTRDGLPSNEVNALTEDNDGRLWLGTPSGLAVIVDGKATSAGGSHHSLAAAVLGMASDDAGALWIAVSDRLLRVDAGRLASGAAAPGEVRELGVADGLPPFDAARRLQSVVKDGRGRIWLATTAGVSVVDPARVVTTTMPALTQIEGLSADGRAIEVHDGVRVPAGPQRLSVSYAGISLAVPERVRYRYRLDGFDADWSEPRQEREATYTNLRPGPYRFRVKASNAEGQWTETEAALAFSIAPHFWQTPWFQLSAMAAGGLAIWAAYRIRVRQVARQLNLRFEERLAERTRIAQELHDTLLQGFVSASMQLHVAADRLPDDSPAKPAIARVTDLMRRVIDEGRNAVRGLRSPTGGADDLERAFAGIHQEMAPSTASYRVIVYGRPLPLNPVIRDEVYRIGREALINAFRHAEAKAIELQIDYSARQFTLRVRDDGRGIDERVVAAGVDGHWGLSGMRERATRIGAGFNVWSREEAGTEIELVIPGRIAFAPAGPGSTTIAGENREAK